MADLSPTPHVDVAAAEMLAALRDELAARNVRLRVVERRPDVLRRLRAEGVEDVAADADSTEALARAVDEHLASR